jgi:GNAT superfamily N-acetyltransferase
MEKEYEIIYVEHPGEAWGIIGQGITEYNNQQVGDENAQILCFVLQGPDHEIAGGIIAQVYWDWLYVDLMWMKEEARHHGYGHRLLALVEDEARKRGATKAFLDTFSFQAPGFYEKHGYQIFGELNDFPKGHKRHFFTKEL